MEEFEKQFINWTIAQLKKARKPVDVMVSKLKQNNPELGEYAQSIASKIDVKQEKKYEIMFQESLVEACMKEPDPQAAAKEFFKAAGINNPGLTAIVSRIIKGR